MDDLSRIARHWSRQTEKGKGLRLEAAQIDLLNAIGVGELIQKEAAEYQRRQAASRLRIAVDVEGSGKIGTAR